MSITTRDVLVQTLRSWGSYTPSQSSLKPNSYFKTLDTQQQYTQSFENRQPPVQMAMTGEAAHTSGPDQLSGPTTF
jgi:hypothetical protein